MTPERARLIVLAAILIAGCAGRSRPTASTPPQPIKRDSPIEAVFTGDETFVAQGDSTRLARNGQAVTIDGLSAISGSGRTDVFCQMTIANTGDVAREFDPADFIVMASGLSFGLGQTGEKREGDRWFETLHKTPIEPAAELKGVLWFVAAGDLAEDSVDLGYGEETLRFRAPAGFSPNPDSAVFPKVLGVYPRPIDQPQPVYPRAARAGNVTGTVVIAIVVDHSGHVTSATLLSGPEIFAAPGIAAVQRWRYEPIVVNGVPIRWKAKISLHFRLRDSGSAESVSGRTPNCLHSPKPVYPPEARETKMSGVVVAEISVNRNGHVRGVKILTGDPVFRKATRKALLTWRYEPSKLPWTANVTLRFALPESGVGATETQPE